MIKFNRIRPIQETESLVGHVFLIDDEPYLVASTELDKIMLIAFDGSRWGDTLYGISTDCENILYDLRQECIADTVEYIGRCNITIEPEH